jgi:hypothetical protein
MTTAGNSADDDERVMQMMLHDGDQVMVMG